MDAESKGLKRLWIIFSQAEMTPGTTSDNKTGLLSISDFNKQLIEGMYRRAGSRVVSYGMTCGDGISLDSYRELFAGVQARGEHIRPASVSREEPQRMRQGDTRNGGTGKEVNEMPVDAGGWSEPGTEMLAVREIAPPRASNFRTSVQFDCRLGSRRISHVGYAIYALARSLAGILIPKCLSGTTRESGF